MILDHDRFVVAALVAMVGLIGLSIALLDGWLDRRLPHALSGRRMPAVVCAIVALLGALLIFPHGTPPRTNRTIEPSPSSAEHSCPDPPRDVDSGKLTP